MRHASTSRTDPWLVHLLGKNRQYLVACWFCIVRDWLLLGDKGGKLVRAVCKRKFPSDYRSLNLSSVKFTFESSEFENQQIKAYTPSRCTWFRRQMNVQIREPIRSVHFLLWFAWWRLPWWSCMNCCSFCRTWGCRLLPLSGWCSCASCTHCCHPPIR